jgi:hypothetical protein
MVKSRYFSLARFKILYFWPNSVTAVAECHLAHVCLRNSFEPHGAYSAESRSFYIFNFRAPLNSILSLA